MRLESDEKGDLYLDPYFVAKRLCLDPGELQRRMKVGLVSSLVEDGIGEDEGLKRITLRCGAIAWRAVVDRDNRIASEEMISLSGRGSPSCAAG